MARHIPLPPASPEVLEKIRAGLPEYFPRAHIERWTNGVFSASYMKWLKRTGEGPKLCYIGKKCVITKEAFMEWLERMYYNQGVVYGTGDPQTNGDVPERPSDTTEDAGR